MKKIYAILVAAVMSINLFAAPSQADLASYLEEGYYVACFKAPVDCENDIYWMGEYCGWKIDTPLEDLVQCEALTGANAGWYVAKVPVVEGKSNDGKPIQLNECGKLTWDVQPSNEPIEVLDGSVTVDSKDNGESDLKGFTTEKATIFTITSWKGNYNPCEKVCEQQSYTIRIYPPYCEYLEEVEPTIKGSFNQWGDAITMEFKGSYYEYVSEPVSASFEFKFNNDPAGSWTHQFQYYDAENDETTDIPASGNLSLTNGKEFYTYDAENRILTFDFEDTEKFQYAGCEEQENDHVVITLIAPAGAPEAGIELAGDFASADWTVFQPMELQEDGSYTAELDVVSTNVFKFREAGSWANEIETFDGTEWKGLPNLKFGDLWEDAEGHKVINLDYSDATTYRWKANAEGIENITLTEKAQKVVVDGVIYIVRDNKMFTVQGTQVR